MNLSWYQSPYKRVSSFSFFYYCTLHHFFPSTKHNQIIFSTNSLFSQNLQSNHLKKTIFDHSNFIFWLIGIVPFSVFTTCAISIWAHDPHSLPYPLMHEYKCHYILATTSHQFHLSPSLVNLSNGNFHFDLDNQVQFFL